MAGWSVAEIARRLGGEVAGEGARVLTGVRGLADAGPEHLSFLANRRYTRQLHASKAGALLVGREVEAGQRTVIRLDDPYLGFARAMALFHPIEAVIPGVDALARVASDAVVEGARIDAFAWVGPGAIVGPGTWVEPGAFVGAGARVGRDCRLMPNSAICSGCAIGDRVWINPGAVVGGEGFGFALGPAGWEKIPQVGVAAIEDDVEIGANTTVDRAALGETRVRRGAILDNLVQIGHGAEVGEQSCLVAFSGIAGSTRIGRGVTLAARATVLGHLTLGDGVSVGASSTVHGDQPAGARVTGTPAIAHRRWLRAATAFGDLPDLIRQMRALEARVGELEAALAAGGKTKETT